MFESFMFSETQQIIGNILILVLVSAGFIIIIFSFIFKWCYQKQLERLLAENKKKNSERLMEVLYSERHEYQNCLQVLKAMATLGATERIDKYLSGYIAQMKSSSGFIKVSDPVLAASIASYQVKAKEYNIIVKVNCSTSLKGISHISVDLGEIFNLFFETMIGCMTSLKGSGNEIIISIEERTTEYSFDFKTDRFFGVSKVSIFSADKFSIHSVRNRHLKQIDEIQKKVKEIKGKFYFVAKDDNVLRLKLNIRKRNDLILNNRGNRDIRDNQAVSV